ncbi:MAG: NfeD family protein [Dehalococcoidales bacterium]
MQRRANKLLIWKIISTAFEEAVLAAAVLWVLPALGLDMPPWLLALAMPALAAYNVFTYRKGIEALRTEPMPGMTTMVGIKGEVIRSLAPEGIIRVKGELWTARSAAGSLVEGQRVVVVDQQRLKLVVEATDGADGAPAG